MDKHNAQKQWIESRKKIAEQSGSQEIEVENIYSAIVDHCIDYLKEHKEFYLPKLVEMKWKDGQIKATSKIEIHG